jgi:thymidylate synthase ThyX
MKVNELEVELLSSWQGNKGGDGAVAHAAWASSTDLSKLEEKTDQDIRRVTTNVVNLHHDTPKERVWVEFFITCPIFVERQFDKYRMTLQYQDFQITFNERPMGGNAITQNELSGRYRTIPERFYHLPKDVVGILDRDTPRGYKTENSFYCEFMESQYHFYQDVLSYLKDRERLGKITNAEYKRAREVIRGVLGTAFLTNMRICMNLNAFEHIVNQRLAKDTQLESRWIAYMMIKEIVKTNVAPVVISEMIKVNGWDVLMKELEDFPW